jgi:hypothetical protein
LTPWPLTLKINRVPDSPKDQVCTKFGQNSLNATLYVALVSFDIAFLICRFRFFSLYFVFLLYRFRRFFSLDFVFLLCRFRFFAEFTVKFSFADCLPSDLRCCSEVSWEITDSSLKLEDTITKTAFCFFSLDFVFLLCRFRFFCWISFSYFTDFVAFCFRFVLFRFSVLRKQNIAKRNEIYKLRKQYQMKQGQRKAWRIPSHKIRPCDLDLWPWKSIGFQILLRFKYVPSLVWPNLVHT